MKRIIYALLFISSIVTIGSCTENQRARNFGGTETIKLNPGRRLILATWKQDNLWYLTEPMPEGYVPQEKVFVENSSYGVMEGTVVFIERR